MRTQMCHNWLKLVLLAWCFQVFSALAAEPANSGDPLNGTWRVCLEAFFPAKKAGGPARALPIYVISREGKFLYGLGSAPDWNQTTYPSGVASLRYDPASGKLSGSIKIKLNSDPWIPKDAQPIECAVDLQGMLDRANPTNTTALKGTYRGKRGPEEVSGALSGYVYTQALVDLGHCQIILTLNHALVGGREPYHNRIAVRFETETGKAVAAQFGMVDLKNAPYDFRPFNKFNLATSQDGFSGEFTIPYEVLGAVGDTLAQYAFKLEGKRINNLCGGEFSVTVTHAGKTSTHVGSFKGSINPAVQRQLSF